MTDERDLIEEPTPDELAGLHELLARADVWDEPPPGLEDAVVAAIATEAARAPLAPPTADDVAVPSLDEHRAGKAHRRSRSNAPWWLGAAAAAVLVVGGVTILSQRGGDDDPIEQAGAAIDLSPAEAAGSASANAQISATPAGLKIVLDVDDLPGAPEGFFYEAWLSDGDIRVSAGTFHLREGDDPIALWAGVADPAFNKLSVTLEPLDGDPASSGDVRFVGEFDFADALPDADQ